MYPSSADKEERKGKALVERLGVNHPAKCRTDRMTERKNGGKEKQLTWVFLAEVYGADLEGGDEGILF